MYWKTWNAEQKNLPETVKKAFKQDHKFQEL